MSWGWILLRSYVYEKINIPIYTLLLVWNNIFKFCPKYLCMKIILGKSHEALSHNFKHKSRFKYIYNGKKLTYRHCTFTRFSFDFRKTDLSTKFENDQCWLSQIYLMSSIVLFFALTTKLTVSLVNSIWGLRLSRI